MFERLIVVHMQEVYPGSARSLTPASSTAGFSSPVDTRDRTSGFLYHLVGGRGMMEKARGFLEGGSNKN